MRLIFNSIDWYSRLPSLIRVSLTQSDEWKARINKKLDLSLSKRKSFLPDGP